MGPVANESMMHRRWILWSAAVAVAIVALSFAASDGVPAGVIAATRNSARFSALVFAVALVARAGRPSQLAADQAELTLAFVAAHGIHYATVVARAAIEPENRLRQLSAQPLAVVGAGFGLLSLLALTARAKATRWRRTHQIAFGLVGLSFAIALGSRARVYTSSALALSVLAAAFVWRLAAVLRRPSAAGHPQPRT